MNQVDHPFIWKLKAIGTEAGPSLLWLHGFMGSGRDWQVLADQYFPDHHNILVDLPGHGTSILTQPIDFHNSLDLLVSQLARKGVEKFIPVGYSMGGRLAFHLQYFFPHMIPALILLSSAPGMREGPEKQLRRLADEHLAARIQDMGWSQFLIDWYSADLFGNIAKDAKIFMELKRSRAKNDMEQLTRSLRLMGNGTLESRWDSLAKIDSPTLLLTGALDRKYCELNQDIKRQIRTCHHEEIPLCGHAFHIEKPLETAQLIRHFLSEITEGD